MILQMWEFIKFLGLVILILILIAIIFAIIDTIYSNIKLSIFRKITLNSLKEQLKDIDSNNIIIEKIDNLDKKDNK